MSLQKLANFLSSPLEDDFKHEFDIEYFAKKASDNYFSNKVPLNESIKKFASDNGFNTEQTKRICEASNHNVNQHLFNTQEDKNIYFDIADASQITSEDSIKTASVNEYSFTPKEISSWARKEDEELQKTAIIGPILNLGLLGLPGVIGHSMGKSKGKQHYQNSEIPKDESVTKGLLIPGYSGYRRGLGDGINESYQKDAPDYINNLNKLVDEGMKDKDISDLDQELADRGIKMPNLHEVWHPTKGISWEKPPSAQQKMTHVELSGLDPKLNLQAVKEKVASALQKVQDDIYLADFKVKEAKYRLYKEAKVVLKDAPYYKLAQAIAMSTNRHEILEDLTYDLMNERLVTEEDMFAIVKTAGELEERHPIVIWTKKFASLLDSFDSSLAAENELQTQLLTIEKELK